MVRYLIPLAVIIVIVTGSTSASIIGVSPLVGVDFNNIGVNLESVSGWPAITTPMDDVALYLQGEVTSQVFYDNTVGGNYYYFYQVANTGLDQSWHIIEVLSLSPFTDADGSTSIGYLTANEPAAFVSSAPLTAPTGASINTDSGPRISFGFPGYFNPIQPQQYSNVLYVESPLPPTEIMGYIIDGAIAEGLVIGPVPEPATISLLGLSGLLMLRRTRKSN